MGLAGLLSVIPFWIDLALLQGLRDRWDRDSNTFLLPWGQMTPTLEDVARLTGLRVHGDPVTGTTQGDYRDLARRALGYEDRGLGPLRMLRGSAITELLGVRGLRKMADESLAEYVDRVGQALAGRWVQEDGRMARRQLRIFLFFFFGRILFATKGSSVSLRFLSLIADLRQVGTYAWGAAMLAHLFYHLSRSVRKTGISGFSPFLQVWAYYYLPLTIARLPRAIHPVGEIALLLPYMARWIPRIDRRNMYRQLETVKRGLAEIQEGEITWRPYEGDTTEGQPWVVDGQRVFRRDIFLHALSFIEPLFVSLVMRTIGFHQANVDMAALGERVRRSQRYVGLYETDWAGEHDEEVLNWHRGGTVVSSTASSSAEYLQNYRTRYRDRLQIGRADATHGERILELETQLLASEAEVQRLRGIISELRGELRGLRGGTGASSSSGQLSDREELISLRRQLGEALSRAQAAEDDVAGQVASLKVEISDLQGEREQLVVTTIEDRKQHAEQLQEAAAAADRRVAEVQEESRREIASLQQQLESARLSSSGDPVTLFRLSQLEEERGTSRAEIERLRAREMELFGEMSGWKNRAEYLEARDRERSRYSRPSRSHQTSQVSKPGSKRTRPEESGAEGGGGDRAGGEGGGDAPPS
uniref:Serine/threonine-protein phosphatase 7 long form n=1 Tax=Anthurium amnicola TaxID=1678845 RepID=A0A1D1YFN5_9ARAE